FVVSPFVLSFRPRPPVLDGLEVCSKASQRFADDVSSRSLVGVHVEPHLSERRVDVAAPRVRGRPDSRALGRLPEKRESGIRLSRSIHFGLLRAIDSALRTKRALELMIPRRQAEEIV